MNINSCKIRIILCFLIVFALLNSTKASAQLADKYRRNGEVYLLIGTGPVDIVGIYRFNNAEEDLCYPDPLKYVGNTHGENIVNAIGFFVDLKRMLYPFNRKDGKTTTPEFIYRQVVDDIDYLYCDYGTHSYQHTDARFRVNDSGSQVAWCRGDPIYRSNMNRPANPSSTQRYMQYSGCVPTITNSIQSSNESTRQAGAARTGGNFIYCLGPGTPSSRAEFEGLGRTYVADFIPVYYNGNTTFGSGSNASIYNFSTSGTVEKNWYKIKNQSWFSVRSGGYVNSWSSSKNNWNVPSTAENNRSSADAKNRYFWTVGDIETIKANDYYVYCFACLDGSGNPVENFNQYAPNYDIYSIGNNLVGTTYDTNVVTYVRNGCLDSCGISNSTGGGVAPMTKAWVAFQPALLTSTTGDRSYFYSRTDGTSTGKIKYTFGNGTNGEIGITNPYFRGIRDHITTEWIGISLQSSDNDYVYALGDKVIKDWYSECHSGAGLPSGTEITAATVSNQWEQKGGIVFGYDKTNKIIYKFVRDDTQPSGSQIKAFEGIPLSGVATSINSYNTELDDIQADGFGNLFIALSYPAKDSDVYNPPDHFRKEDAFHVHTSSIPDESGAYEFNVIFVQTYGKAVFKRDRLTYEWSKVGQKSYAYKVYYIGGTASADLKARLDALGANAGNWFSTIKSYLALPTTTPVDKANCQINSNLAELVSDIDSSMFFPGKGICHGTTGLHGQVSYYAEAGNSSEDPGKSRLGVINVPTPEEVRHIGPYKASYLDICGPYTPLPPFPDTDNKKTNQRPGDVAYNALNEKTIYFYMVENYPIANDMDTKPQDPNTDPDYDYDTRAGGFISSIRNARSESEGGDVRYEWALWQVEDMNGKPCCTLYNSSASGDNSFGLWVLGGAKFILCCRVYYTWYDYDKLPFGSTIDDIYTTPGVKQQDYAWPSQAGMTTPPDIIDWEATYGNPPTTPNVFEMASATKRLTEIMTTNPEFNFMLGSPADADGNPINYYSKILGNNYTTDEKTQYWALEPIVVSGKPPTIDATLVASLERCDRIEKTDGSAAIAPESYVLNNAYWSNSSTADDKIFGIAANRGYFWRMALASQSNLFYDISTTTNLNPAAPDFNVVAYLLSTPTLPDGSANPTYVNGLDPNVEFRPDELGSCWWQVESDSSGSCTSVDLYQSLDYKAPDGTIKTIAFKGNGKKTKPAGTNWSPGELYAEMPKNFCPPTDPQVATLTVRMMRWFYCKMHVLNNEVSPPVDRGTFNIGPLPITIEAKAQVRIVDLIPPTIVYEKTEPMNLYGLTGRALDSSINGNPEYVTFTLRDNNPNEGTSIVGLTTLSQHVANYLENFGNARCEKYVNYNPSLPANRLSAHYSNSVTKTGIDNDIQACMNAGVKSSHLNYKPLYCSLARDTRLVFESSARNEDGSISLAKADSLLYNGSSYTKDASVFDGDDTDYAYYFGKAHTYFGDSSGNSAPIVGWVDDGSNVYHSTAKYTMPLANIKLQNGNNIVPDGYANNTPGYRPYRFYVRSTDCSGNYTKTNTSDSKINGNLLLNMALHVRDDIAPIPSGWLYDGKTIAAHGDGSNHERYFPQEELVNATDTPNVLHTYKIDADGSNGFKYFMDLDERVLRTNDWVAGDTADGFFVLPSPASAGKNYKSLLSFWGISDNITGMDIKKKPEVINKANLVTQLRNHINPYFVEDNVECTFGVNSTDNAGKSIASISFKYYISNVERTNSAVSEFIATGTRFIDGIDINPTAGIYTPNIARTLFRGNRDDFPLAIPVLIVATDDAKDWDHYDESLASHNVSAVSDTQPCGSFSWNDSALIPGSSADNFHNRRRYLTTLVVFKSGLDVRLLEKSLKNN